ncbi:MAG: CHASE3 domain-containing protein, partial [Nitriliruptoraceae bacterium]|nr:CHASE3 domain-containing protein [Nitriliruptoraceae bacterium]
MRQRFRSLTVQRQLAIGFAIPLILLVVVGAVGYSSIDTLDDQATEIADVRQVGVEIREVTNLLRDAEFYEAEYLLTGNARYLEGFERSVTALDEEFVDLWEYLTLEENRTRLAELEPLVDQDLAQMRATMEVRDASGLEASIVAFEAQDGSFGAQIDELTAAMQETQNVQLVAAMQAMDDTAARNKWVILLSSLAALVLAGGLATYIAKQTAAALRARADELNSSSERLASVSAQMGANAEETSSQADVVAAAGEQVSSN